MKRLKKILIFILCATIPTPVFAKIDDSTLHFYSKNNILYYDSTGTQDCTGSTKISVNISSLPEETIEKIEKAGIKEKIEKNMSRYLYAQNETGVPWQILAAIHWREGGADSNKSILNGDKLYGHINIDGQWVDSNPNTDAKNAANHLKEVAKMVYGITDFTTIENIANTFLAYNRGFMYKNTGNTWDKSPYVMNYYDEDHWEMKWIYADSWNGSKQLNEVEERTDQNIGALPILIYLNGVSSGTSSKLSASTDGSDVTIIGDSITFASLEALKDKLPQADITAEVGRSFETGIKIAANPSADASYNFNDSYNDNGKLTDNTLRKNVIFALGSNSTLTKETIQSAISTIGSDKNIYFLTNYATSDGSYKSKTQIYEKNNELLKAVSTSNITIIDWAEKVKTGNFLSSDGLHPNNEGQELFAELIYNEVYKTSNSSACSNGSWNGDFPYYNQCDSRWGNLSIPNSDGYTICKAACGPTSFAMMATALLGKEILPDETAKVAGNKGLVSKSYGGSASTLGKELASYYNLTYERFANGSETNEQLIEKMNKYLREGWMLQISGGGDPFCSSSGCGHVIGIRGITDNGNWLIADSNGWNENDSGPGKERTTSQEGYDPHDYIGNMGRFRLDAFKVN